MNVDVYAEGGTLTGRATLNLPGGRLVSRLLTELVAASGGQLRGYVMVQSTQPLITQELFGVMLLSFLSAVPPVTPKPFDNWVQQVLIGVQTSHRGKALALGGFVFGNLLLNLISMRAYVSPGVGQILGLNRGITSQQIRLTGSQLPGSLQHQNGK